MNVAYEIAAHTARCTVAADILRAFSNTCIALSESAFSFRMRVDDATLAILVDYARDDDSLTVEVADVRDGDDVHTQAIISLDEPRRVLIAVTPLRPMTREEWARHTGRGL